MKKKNFQFLLEEQNEDFQFAKSKSNLNIKFNRVAFIFFIFCLVFLIYSIHLFHLGSRKSDININKKLATTNIINRANIIDRNGSFLAKTVASIDIGINPSEIIDQKKLLLNLKFIFPNKDYDQIKSNIKKKKIFLVRKKSFRGKI